jgi:hypothetical protein
MGILYFARIFASSGVMTQRFDCRAKAVFRWLKPSASKGRAFS